MAFTYKPRGVCSQAIILDLDGDTIKKAEFIGVARLVEGMKARDAIEKLEGIKCGPRPTSCPDQLALALREALEKANTP